MPRSFSPPIPGSCQSCTFLGMQRNGPLDPGFRIPGAPRFLRGWSVSVGGCPLAERRATTHPPGSLTPKERASNLWEQCSLQRRGAGGGGGTHSRALAQGEEALLGCSQVPRSQKVCLCFTWQRHGRSSLGSAARLPQQPGFLLLVYSSTPKVLKRLPASRPNPQAGIWEVDVGTSSEILTTRGAGAWGFGVP